MSRIPFLHPILFLIFTILISGCGSNHETMARMDRADSIMETAPDSALCILDSINPGTLASKKEKARYALLKSMAYDKNYIDTTSFDVIQPAIDYYLSKGNPNEKLRTLFYQGRIYQNRNEDEEAMKCFIKAIELKDEITDSMVLARTYNAQGFLYEKQSIYPSFIKSILLSYNIYKQLHHTELEMNCLNSAINGSLWVNNKIQADSLLVLADSTAALLSHTDKHFLHCKIIYAIDFMENTMARSLLDSIGKIDDSLLITLDLAYGYDKLNCNDIAFKYLSKIKEEDIDSDYILKYLSIKYNILNSLGYYEKALNTFNELVYIRDSINSKAFTQEIRSVEKRYQLEKAISEEKHDKKIVYLSALSGGLLFIIFIAIIIIKLRDMKIMQMSLNQKNVSLEVEKNNLLEEKDNLKLEKNNLVTENNNLEIKNNSLELERNNLEAERDSISSQLSEQQKFSASLQSLMKERLNILNGLLAYNITSNEKYAREYLQLKEDLSNNKSRFLKTLRENMKRTYPIFMAKLVNIGLTDIEINYVCLYALGLRGKEIGTYLGTKRHYNVSSEIRNKLRLDSNDTNLGAYIKAQL
ncbi:MAG: DUF3450 domain-containing protein [Bacteroidales bacterium]|nr:DUF3450 domain-containing protein [Bacteroidales bacterium]